MLWSKSVPSYNFKKWSNDHGTFQFFPGTKNSKNRLCRDFFKQIFFWLAENSSLYIMNKNTSEFYVVHSIVAPQDYYVGKNTTIGAASTKVCSPVVQYDEADIILVLQPQQHTKSPRAFIAKVCKKLLSQRLFHLHNFSLLFSSLFTF